MAIRRPLFITLVQILFISYGCLIAIRLIHLQLVNGSFYQKLSENNRIFVQDIPAERGVLLSRYKQPLVHNKRLYLAAIDDQLFSQLRPVSQPEALAISATASGKVQFQLLRSYVLQSLSTVLGYTSLVSAADLEKRDDVQNLLLVDQVGRMGLEQSMENVLRGKPGTIAYEINALGKKQQQSSEAVPTPGGLVQTTIDPYITEVANRAFADQTGAVVILDVKTGQVLTLLSKPSFDANQLQPLIAGTDAEKVRQQQVQSYLSDEQKVFFNRATSGLYPPGSLFKLVTALGGLEAGVIDAQTEVEDRGTITVGEYSYANWYFTQYGRVEGIISLEKALARSNDIYFYRAAEKLGPDALAQAARLHGFGKQTGIELMSEAAGLVPDPAWKEKIVGEPWYLGNTFHYGIGQGDILVTPIQLAQLLQTIGHKQQLCQPSLITEKSGVCRDLGVSESATTLVLKGMLAACSPGGTAFPFFSYNQQRVLGADVKQNLDNGAVACKTGTAEFGAADSRGYRKTHAWFGAIIGTKQLLKNVQQSQTQDTFATAASDSAELSLITTDDQLRTLWLEQVKIHGFPDQLVIVVLVESSTAQPFQEGSRDAAPVAKKIVDWMVGTNIVSTTATNSAAPKQ